MKTDKAPLRVADEWLSQSPPKKMVRLPQGAQPASGSGLALPQGSGRHAERLLLILSRVQLGEEAGLSADEREILAAWEARGGLCWRPGDAPLNEEDG